MNPEIKKLIEELLLDADEMLGWIEGPREKFPSHRAATILQAIFDPENQPSQFGTVLLDQKVRGGLNAQQPTQNGETLGNKGLTPGLR